MTKPQQTENGIIYPFIRQNKCCNALVFNCKTELKKASFLSDGFLLMGYFCLLFVTRIFKQNLVLRLEQIIKNISVFATFTVFHFFSSLFEKKSTLNLTSHHFC